MRKAYTNYKASGTAWIGDIPEHWEMKPLKYICVADSEKLPDSTPGDYELLYVDIGSVSLVDGIKEKLPMLFEDAPSRARKRVKDGDTIVSTVRTYLKAIAFISAPESNLVVSTGFAVISPKNIHRKFLSYLLQSTYFVEKVVSISNGVSYPATNTSDIMTIKVPFVPTEKEAAAISEYLDGAVEKIDALIAKKNEFIERLKEKRTALISQIVTRGLPPEKAKMYGLPVNSKIKPSGIDWLGEIPEHWTVEKFSREIAIAEGQVDPSEEPFSEMVLIAPDHIEAKTGRLIELKTARDQNAESGKYLVRKNDVVYSKIRPALQKVCVSPVDGLCSADMYPLRARKKISHDYLYWIFLTQQFGAWSVLESDRVAMPKINRETLNQLWLPIPPHTEQQAISTYLSDETKRVDGLISTSTKAIEVLNEYRSSLITSAVTGKIDVREATI